jgi:hypothetical protein
MSVAAPTARTSTMRVKRGGAFSNIDAGAQARALPSGDAKVSAAGKRGAPAAVAKSVAADARQRRGNSASVAAGLPGFTE